MKGVFLQFHGRGGDTGCGYLEGMMFGKRKECVVFVGQTEIIQLKWGMGSFDANCNCKNAGLISQALSCLVKYFSVNC